MTAVEWLVEKIFSDFGKSVKSQEIKMAMQIEKQQIIDAANQNQFDDIDGMGISDTITKGEQYYNETYGSKGSDETKEEALQFLATQAQELGLYDTSSQTEIKDNKIMLLEEDLWCVHKYLDDLNIERNDMDGKQYSIVGRIKLLENRFLYQMSELETNLSTSQPEISEHRFTEKDIRFAYMQGYNRGVDGNPNHMESYIEHLKSTKLSQTEISDEEWVGCDGCTETDEYFWKKGFQAGYTKAKPVEISDEEIEEMLFHHSNEYAIGFKDAIKWYREQLKQRQ